MKKTDIRMILRTITSPFSFYFFVKHRVLFSLKKQQLKISLNFPHLHFIFLQFFHSIFSPNFFSILSFHFLTLVSPLFLSLFFLRHFLILTPFHWTPSLLGHSNFPHFSLNTLFSTFSHPLICLTFFPQLSRPVFS